MSTSHVTPGSFLCLHTGSGECPVLAPPQPFGAENHVSVYTGVSDSSHKGEPEQRVIKEERPWDPGSMPSRVTEGVRALTEKGGISRGWRKDVLLNLEPHHPSVSLVKTILGASLEQLDGEWAASMSGQWSGQSSCGEAEVRAGHLSTCLSVHIRLCLAETDSLVSLPMQLLSAFLWVWKLLGVSTC